MKYIDCWSFLPLSFVQSQDRANQLYTAHAKWYRSLAGWNGWWEKIDGHDDKLSQRGLATFIACRFFGSSECHVLWHRWQLIKGYRSPNLGCQSGRIANVPWSIVSDRWLRLWSVADQDRGRAEEYLSFDGTPINERGLKPNGFRYHFYSNHTHPLCSFCDFK